MAYCTCVFLMTGPFTLDYFFLPCNLDFEDWPTLNCLFEKTLTLAIPFKPIKGLSYCACVFLVPRLFAWYYKFWPCDLDLLLKNFNVFNLCHNFQTRRDRAFIYKCTVAYVYSLWQDHSHGTIIFYFVTLTLKFDLLLKKLNLDHNFQTRRNRVSYCTYVCMYSLWQDFSHGTIIFVPPAKHSGTKGSLCPASLCPSVCPSVHLSVR